MLDTKLNRKPLSVAAWVVIVVALAALAVPAAAVGVFGQGGAGSLSGTLRDPQGRPIPNTNVTLSQAGSATVHKAQTDAAGAFVLAGLQAGDYTFEQPIPGFAKQYPVTVRPGQRSQADVTVRLGQVREEITVTSRAGMPPPPPTPPPTLATRRPVPPPYDPATDPCRKPGASACVQAPRKTKDVRPVVPAGREGDTATVVIEGEIGTDGTMQGTRLSQPTDAQFGKAGLDAVNQWLFTPTRLNGEPVATSIIITIQFVSGQ